MEAMRDDEIDGAFVPLRQAIALLTDERERCNVQVADSAARSRNCPGAECDSLISFSLVSRSAAVRDARQRRSPSQAPPLLGTLSLSK